MTTVSPKEISMRRDTFSHVKRIIDLENEDMHLLIANYVLGEDLTSGLSEDKRDNLDQIKKLLKFHKKQKIPIESTLSESTTIEEVKIKVKEEKKKKKVPLGLTKEVKNKYLAACEGTYFLASKAVDKNDGYGSLEYISNMKIKLEAAYGATIGSGSTRKDLEQNGVFKENKPFGPFKIILNDDLGLHHKDLGEKIWQQHYRDYAAETRFGVLILAGKPEYFQIWANSDACLEEVKEIPSDRLYAYIEHKKEDGFETNQGFIVSVDAENYKGSATVRDGKGYMIFHNGNYYHGELKGGLRNGIGTEMFASGETYKGQHEDDKKHGRGVFKFASGNVYDGEWENDKQHGRGVNKFADGEVYDGEWEDGKMHGKGVYKYASGAVYDGEWENGIKHGRGVYKFANGDVYDGEWEDDKQHGNAIYTTASCKKTKDVWENGKRISETKIN